MSSPTVDQALVEQYRADGCVVVRGLFSPDEVDTVREGIERNLAEPGPLFGVASRDDDPGRFVEDFCNWQRIPEYRAIAFDSPAADVAPALLQFDRGASGFSVTEHAVTGVEMPPMASVRAPAPHV